MHPFSVLTLGIFVAGYITARWDLVTRLYELAIFAWDHGVVVCLRPWVLATPPLATYQLVGSIRCRRIALTIHCLDTNCEGFLVSVHLLFPTRPTNQSPRVQGGSIGEQSWIDQMCSTPVKHIGILLWSGAIY
jgi:hypothetical protein